MTLTIEHETIFCAVARDGTAGGCWKMGGEDKPPTISVFLEEFDTGQSRLIGIRAKTRAPCRIAHLQRVMHQVGTQDRFVSLAAETHDVRPGVWPGASSNAMSLASMCSSPIRSACPALKIGKTLSVM